jgi:hypothetical protein
MEHVVRRLIHPNGSIEVLPGPMPAMALSKLIGADIIDTVNLPNGMVMIPEPLQARYYPLYCWRCGDCSRCRLCGR